MDYIYCVFQILYEMREKEFLQVGKIHQTHGLNGEVNVSFSDTNKLHHLLKKGAYCFIEIRNKTFIPYQIITCQKNGLSAYMSFDMFSDIDKAKGIAGKNIYLHLDQIPQSYLQEFKDMWVGYTVIDSSNSNTIGIIDEVIKSPGQVLGLIHVSNKELLLPLNDDLIQLIDHNDKTIRMDIPSGLLDI